MQRCYAIGDVHGQLERFDAALERIAQDGYDGEPIVFLGDYVDRGPDSRGVIERLIAGQAQGRNWIALKGNHDRMFSRFVAEACLHDARILSRKTWLHPALGGQATLASYLDLDAFARQTDGGSAALEDYGQHPRHDADLARLHAQARAAVPPAHLAFLAGLPLTHDTGTLLFVHAGLRPGVPLHDQDEDDLVWIRDGWLDDPRDHGRLVVHGHTALEFPAHHGNRVNVDAGAGYGRPLVPVVFEGTRAWALTQAGRVPL